MLRGQDLYSKQNELIVKSKRELENGKRKEPLRKMRLLCYTHGPTGFLKLGRALRKLDDDGSRKLNIDEFTKGFRDAKVNCTDFEIKQIFDMVDPEKTGGIHVSDFLDLLRPEMPVQRANIIDKAFAHMDKEGTGAVTLKEIRSNYLVKNDPKYLSGELTSEEIMTAFFNNFKEGNRTETPDRVTREDFINYYAIVSAAIDYDAYFDLMMRQLFKL